MKLGADHLDVARDMGDLGMIYMIFLKKEKEADLFLSRSLEISEKNLGSEHIDIVQSLNKLAMLRMIQGRFKEAEPLLRRALVICENKLGDDHSETKSIRKNLDEITKAIRATK
jgi:hypothetical protein